MVNPAVGDPGDERIEELLGRIRALQPVALVRMAGACSSRGPETKAARGRALERIRADGREAQARSVWSAVSAALAEAVGTLDPEARHAACVLGLVAGALSALNDGLLGALAGDGLSAAERTALDPWAQA
jgi:hypothetical protein